MLNKISVRLKARSSSLTDVAFSIKPLSGLTLLARCHLHLYDVNHKLVEKTELTLSQKDNCALPNLDPNQEQELEFTCNFSPDEVNYKVSV